MAFRAKITSRKNKKIIYVLIAIFALLLADYSLKVKEYNNLVKAHNSWMTSYQEWIVTFNVDLMANKVNTSQGWWTQENINGFERFIANSNDTAIEMFLLNESLERYTVLPWHRDMKYAYEDFSQYLEYEYQTYKSFKLVNKDVGTPAVDLGESDSLPEMIAQAKKSLEDAKPFPNLFLDSNQYEEK